MNDLEITIKVDTNDADYQIKVSTIEQSELDKIMPLIQAIKEFKPYKNKSRSGLEYTHNDNYPYGECCRRDLGEKTPQELYKFDQEIFDIFKDLCPYCEYGFHTIESITVSPVTQKTKLL
jgi:hypothetical protein